MASDTRIGQILQEQTGVDLKIEYLVGDLDTKAGVMMAGGEYPDVISVDGIGLYEKLVDVGALDSSGRLDRGAWSEYQTRV